MAQSLHNLHDQTGDIYFNLLFAIWALYFCFSLLRVLLHVWVKSLGAITLDFEYQKVAYMNKILIIRETYGGTQSECDP